MRSQGSSSSSFARANEELRAVSAGTRVGHRKSPWARVLQLKVLVFELLAVNRFPTCAVTAGEVSSLQHELGDDAMKGGSLEVQRLARLALKMATTE